MCQGNFGPRRCRREPTMQSAFVATSSSASTWCVLGFRGRDMVRIKFSDRNVVPGSIKYVDPGICLTQQNHP